MQSLRRAAVRAATSSRSSLAAAVCRKQLASFATQFGKASSIQPAFVVPAARFFSQTSRSLQEEKGLDGESAAPAETEGREAPAPAEDGAALESSETTKEAQSTGPSIFVGNMTFDATEMHIREAFSKFGEIKTVSIGRDSRGLSRGFCFVVYADQASADRAVAECDKSFWHGRRINVQLRKSRDPDSQSARRTRDTSASPTNSLYIGNIPYETSDADLNKLFRELENITDVRVAVDRNTGWPRGFAHADFTDAESATKALEKLKTMAIGGRQLRVDYSAPRSGYISR